MKIEFHDNFRNPLVLQATRVLITSDDGTPLALAIEHFTAADGRAQFRVFRAGDPDFAQQLRHHGIDKTVLVTSLTLPAKT